MAQIYQDTRWCYFIKLCVRRDFSGCYGPILMILVSIERYFHALSRQCIDITQNYNFSKKNRPKHSFIVGDNNMTDHTIVI